jgi:hypothetical protein
VERRLPSPEEAKKFYRDLVAQGMKVRGLDVSGYARCSERLLAEWTSSCGSETLPSMRSVLKQLSFSVIEPELV